MKGERAPDRSPRLRQAARGHEEEVEDGQPTSRGQRHGQSIWYDSLRRGIIASGALVRFVTEDGLSGLTTNPAIYEKAITQSHDYDAALAVLLLRADLDAKAIYERLAIEDIQAAYDLLRPVYQATGRRDGYVSLEVSPQLARDAAATLAEARRLWRALSRENVMIKVPGTPEAMPAIPPSSPRVSTST